LAIADPLPKPASNAHAKPAEKSNAVPLEFIICILRCFP
jgi:hypothetical protein